MLQVLVGPIASGKSTWCRKQADAGAIIINDDSMVMAWHGGNYQLYDKKKEDFYKAVETNAIVTGLVCGFNVVIDRPNLKRNTRLRYIQIAEMLDRQVVAVTFDNHGPEVHARRRFESDSRGHPYEYWLKAAKFHEGLFEPVQESEGFDNVVPVQVAAQMFEAGQWLA